jgi:hypothetical protein
MPVLRDGGRVGGNIPLAAGVTSRTARRSSAFHGEYRDGFPAAQDRHTRQFFESTAMSVATMGNGAAVHHCGANGRKAPSRRSLTVMNYGSKEARDAAVSIRYDRRHGAKAFKA